MTCGIYKIENKINGKVYIGQSINIERRWKNHKIYSKIDDELLYNEIREYGIENFDWYIIEECNEIELRDKEKYYIKKYNSIFPYGYNKALGSCNSVKLNYDKVKEIRRFLKETNETGLSLAKRFGVSKDTITGINVGRFWFDKDIEYPIRPMAFLFCKKCGAKIHSHNVSGLCKKCLNELHKEKTKNRTLLIFKNNSIISRNELKELIRTKPFTQIGKMFGITDNAIREWCDKYNLPRTKREIDNISDEEWDKL